MTLGNIGELSPLQEIEHRVQANAKHRELDLATADAIDELRSLIEHEIDEWNAAYARGQRPIDIADPEGARERAFRNLADYGPLTPLLKDDDVWEIMVNSPSEVFVRRHRGPSGYHHEVFHDDEHVIRTLTKILDDASSAHRKLDPSEGLQDAQLDNGARLHIVHGDLSRGGHVMVNVRKFTGVAYRSLGELVDQGSLTRPVALFLAHAVRSGASVVFSGAPGSGKTTLLSCSAAELDPAKRVVIAEEVFECDVPLANVASMQTRPPRPERPEIDLRRLVAGFLRMAPDVAIVGEVRDREALPLLLTLSSGVQGFTTIHAGSGRQALSRLRFICQLADTSSELPLSALNTLVSESVDLVVHSARTGTGPRVTEIVAVEDLASAADSTAFTTTTIFDQPHPDEPLQWTGSVPVRLAGRFEHQGLDLPALLRSDDPRAMEAF